MAVECATALQSLVCGHSSGRCGFDPQKQEGNLSNQDSVASISLPYSLYINYIAISTLLI